MAKDGYFKPNKGCKWCKAVKIDPKLMKRIYRSRYFTGKKNAETLKDISNATKLPYQSIRNHVKVHQTLTSDQLNANKLENIARSTSNKLIKTNIQAVGAQQDVTDKLHAELEGLDMSLMKPKDIIDLLIKVSKHQVDAKAKQKDQELDVFKMMQGHRSGYLKPATEEGVVTEVKHAPFDPWKNDLKRG